MGTAKRRSRKASRSHAKVPAAGKYDVIFNLPKPRKSFEELAREQGVKPFTGIGNMPPLFESQQEADDFMKWALELRAAERRMIAKKRAKNFLDE